MPTNMARTPLGDPVVEAACSVHARFQQCEGVEHGKITHGSSPGGYGALVVLGGLLQVSRPARYPNTSTTGCCVC